MINVADFSVRHYDFDDLGATDASLIAKGALAPISPRERRPATPYVGVLLWTGHGLV